jgi:hypothetical protein
VIQTAAGYPADNRRQASSGKSLSEIRFPQSHSFMIFRAIRAQSEEKRRIQKSGCFSQIKVL